VFVGSPADGELHRGDIILSIDNYDVTRMIHKQAMDAIKQAGGSISLRIKRHSSVKQPLPASVPAHTPAQPKFQYRSRPLDTINPTSPTKPTPMAGIQSYGHDYTGPGIRNQPKQQRMLSSVNQSLSDAIVNQATQHPARPYTYTSKPVWQKPKPDYVTTQAPSGLVEPGWAPKSPGSWSPVKAPQAAQFRPHVPQVAPPPRPVNARPAAMQPQHIDPERPAWMGSLKSSGGPKPWEMREAETLAGPEAAAAPHAHPPAQHHTPNVQPHQPRVQNVHYGPGDTAPTYSQHSAGAHNDTDTAQVKHLQYNSPLGLYSKENVEQVLTGQTQGKPGQGTMQVSGGGPPKSFDPQRSDVYKLLLEEETRKKGEMRQHSARYEGPNPHGEMQYQGFMDQSTKSPAMGRLEQHVADISLGTSDF